MTTKEVKRWASLVDLSKEAAEDKALIAGLVDHARDSVPDDYEIISDPIYEIAWTHPALLWATLEDGTVYKRPDATLRVEFKVVKK